ncbi:MAG: SDR family oxidoreductase [Acidimicrobiia bacterium]|nr:SDR family oxidoreductase [Acidimicrobiia bacterium]
MATNETSDRSQSTGERASSRSDGSDVSDAGVAHPLRSASVLVAGATGGLGAAIATEAARRGAELTLVGRDAARLEALDVEGHRVVADLRTPPACEHALDAAIDHVGRLDVVVNAVGVVAFGPIADLSVDVMEELFLTNTFVPILLARAALTRLSAGGAIVNLSGVIAEQNLPGMAAYGASKAAVRSFDEALAREARRAKLRVLDARPPHTETGLADRPLEGAAPRMPDGLAPAVVATVVCDALEAGTPDLASDAFPPGR